MTFEELGAALRTARERRGKSVDDVVQRLKIQPRMLLALEAGDRQSLPDGVYLRGFIRSYGTYLGLDSATLTQALESLSPHTTVSLRENRAAGSGSSRIPWGKALGCLAVLACLAGFAVYWFSHSTEGLSPVSGKMMSQLAQPAPSARVEDVSSPLPATQPDPVASSVPSRPVAQGPSPQDKTPVLAETAMDREQGTTTNAWTATQPGEAQTPPPAGEHEVVVTATGNCFLSIRLDSDPKRRVSMKAGDTLQLPFKEFLRIWARDADNLRLRYDGKDIPTPEGGRERVILFPPKLD